MAAFLKGLKNYQTTITGFVSLLFLALSQAYPEWKPFFDKVAEAFALAFIILVKDANTGSEPGTPKLKM